MLPQIQLGLNWALPTYFLVISLTYTLCLLLVYWRSERNELPTKTALDISLAIMVGGFIGARLFHVVYEEWGYYAAHPLEIIKFWHGGFVFYGGFIGAGIAAWLMVHFKRENFLPWADFFAPVLALGYALGRIGCFCDGCCFGRLCALPWAVEFHGPGMPHGARHPTQLYATFWEFIVFGFLLWLERQPRNGRRPGLLFYIWLTLHATGRILMECFRDDDRGPLLFGFISISTAISLGLFLFATHQLFRRKIS